MRNVEAEQKSVKRLFAFTGLMFLFGIVALAIGTEMMVLEYWNSDPTSFWIWQGVWAIGSAFVLGTIVNLSNRTK
jgi:hypothetical protein